MHVAGVLLTVTSVYSSIHIGTGFLNVGALVTLVGGLYPPLLAPGTSGLKPSFHEGGWTSAKFPRSLRREATAEAASEASPSGEVRLTFKPSDVQVACMPGEVVLEVAQRCSGMVEDSKNPFCRDGGCYNCEVEVVEAADLGLEDNLVRACMFKVPEAAKDITLIQMSSDEAFDGMV